VRTQPKDFSGGRLGEQSGLSILNMVDGLTNHAPGEKSPHCLITHRFRSRVPYATNFNNVLQLSAIKYFA